jgi:hypothetical protein
MDEAPAGMSGFLLWGTLDNECGFPYAGVIGNGANSDRPGGKSMTKRTARQVSRAITQATGTAPHFDANVCSILNDAARSLNEAAAEATGDTNSHLLVAAAENLTNAAAMMKTAADTYTFTPETADDAWAFVLDAMRASLTWANATGDDIAIVTAEVAVEKFSAKRTPLPKWSKPSEWLRKRDWAQDPNGYQVRPRRR